MWLSYFASIPAFYPFQIMDSLPYRKKAKQKAVNKKFTAH
ncbi:hypothetical protein BAME_01380 [Bacillus sp. M 2-6]|nr:hypothetical protein BAME_01380 [Bacillus sp. M 2-6]KIL27637.1 hypothetical protein B4133_0040 [Bacillus altitudinis]PYH23417.1 hypothetical protein US8_01637 [Bacillus altitudinis]